MTFAGAEYMTDCVLDAFKVKYQPAVMNLPEW